MDTLYDEVPYPSYAFAATHPDRLATVATLLGMQPPPVEDCRVLELGCAGAGNLVPMAFSLPGSRFVGIDRSRREVDEGQALVAGVGLKNVELRAMDILEVDGRLGEFDYIIAHGVYSWVPAAVRAKILEICREQLAPQGVAYISFNTYPGWHMKGTLRDIMLYHTRGIEEPLAQAKEARRFLSFLAGAEVTPHGGAHALFLRAYAQYSRDHVVVDQEVNLLHDDLGEVNEPQYFHEFADDLAGHGLRYLADADLSLMLASNLPPAVAERLRRIVHSTIELEQYMDFLRNRAFRLALVCHEGVRLSLPVEVSRLAGLYVASGAEAEGDGVDAGSGSAERFRISSGPALTTNHPVTKAAMVRLAEVWPRSLRFDELLAAARVRLDGSAGADLAEDGRALAANLLKGYGYSTDLVEFHSYAPRFVTEVSRYPVASPVARWQAGRSPFVTNMRHELVTMDGLSHHLLPALDGSRDREALLAMVEELAAQGELLAPDEEGQPASTIPPDRSILAEILDVKLYQMAHSALLIG